MYEFGVWFRFNNIIIIPCSKIRGLRYPQDLNDIHKFLSLCNDGIRLFFKERWSVASWLRTRDPTGGNVRPVPGLVSTHSREELFGYGFCWELTLRVYTCYPWKGTRCTVPGTRDVITPFLGKACLVYTHTTKCKHQFKNRYLTYRV